jgi:hypothetical protein
MACFPQPTPGTSWPSCCIEGSPAGKDGILIIPQPRSSAMKLAFLVCKAGVRTSDLGPWTKHLGIASSASLFQDHLRNTITTSGRYLRSTSATSSKASLRRSWPARRNSPIRKRARFPAHDEIRARRSGDAALLRHAGRRKRKWDEWRICW